MNAEACMDLVARLGNSERPSGDNLEACKEDFVHYLKCSLWGNKCDMSISAGS